MNQTKPLSFKVEIIDQSEQWIGNGLRYKTMEQAIEAGVNLAWRWTAVRDWRVGPSDDAPNIPKP